MVCNKKTQQKSFVKKSGNIKEDSFETSVFVPHPFITEKPETQSDLDSIYNSVKNLRFYEGLLFNDTSDFALMASCNLVL